MFSWEEVFLGRLGGFYLGLEIKSYDVIDKCPGWESNPHALMDTWPSTMPVYQFQHLGKLGAVIRYKITIKPKKSIVETTILFSDRAGARTQDPLLKREMLYQLSYPVIAYTFLRLRVQI